MLSIFALFAQYLNLIYFHFFLNLIKILSLVLVLRTGCNRWIISIDFFLLKQSGVSLIVPCLEFRFTIMDIVIASLSLNISFYRDVQCVLHVILNFLAQKQRVELAQTVTVADISIRTFWA